MRSIEIPQPEDRDFKYRLFEILPGFLTYLILFLPIILAYLDPKAAAYFIVAYLMLWFVRAIGIDLRSIQGWKMLNEHKKLAWEQLNRDLEKLAISTPNPPKWHARNLARVEKYIGAQRIKPSELYHAVIIPFWNETRDVVEPTVQSVLDSEYDPKKIILFIAYEQRGGDQVADLARSLVKEYGPKLHYAESVMHPWPMTGEVIGKGGNATFAARRLQKYLEEEKIDPMRVVVTTLDSDNRPDKKYFGALTYTYCSTEDPKHASYQPVTMYLNNIWDAPAPMRVIATGNSFWNVMLAMRPHMLRNFSAHAQPMAALIDTDFWSVRTIVEDGHQYWRTWFRYDGNHEVYPIYVPIYQDAVLTESYWGTIKMQFVQVRRWAWGCTDIPYFINQAFFKVNNIPLHKKIAKGWRLLEGHLSWSTSPLLLLLAAYPLLFFWTSNQHFGYLANELPQVASGLQRVAMVGIVLSFYLSLRSLPPKPLRYKRRRNLWMVLQWVYLIPTTLIYSAGAAIYSQTRLMFGRYLGWVITEKATKSERAAVADLLK